MTKERKVRVPASRPFTRTPIPPPRVETDRKKKHPRQDKHKKRVLDVG